MRSVNDIMPMIGARFYTQLDAAQMRNDVIEEDLAKVESGYKLPCKLAYSTRCASWLGLQYSCPHWVLV